MPSVAVWTASVRPSCDQLKPVTPWSRKWPASSSATASYSSSKVRSGPWRPSGTYLVPGTGRDVTVPGLLVYAGAASGAGAVAGAAGSPAWTPSSAWTTVSMAAASACSSERSETSSARMSSAERMRPMVAAEITRTPPGVEMRRSPAGPTTASGKFVASAPISAVRARAAAGMG